MANLSDDEDLDQNFEKYVFVYQEMWSKRLKFDFGFLNYCFFQEKLKVPPFRIFAKSRQWGYWKSAPTREIGISAALIAEHPWEHVVWVLKHEMVHQYVDEVLGGDATPHGEKFRKVCGMVNLPYEASCEFSFQPGSVSEETAIFRKIKKIIALTESSNENEARTAMAMANHLLLKHNISLAEVQNQRQYIHKYLGDVLSRIPTELNYISMILNDFFFVSTLWAFSYRALEDKKGQKLQICGLPENVEIAEYVYSYLTYQIEYMWMVYKRSKQLSGQRLRKNYIIGVLSGFYEKLSLERSQCKERGLVWVGDSGLEQYFSAINPRTKSSRRRAMLVDEDVVNDGISAGMQLNIHMGIQKKDGFGGYLQ